MWTSRCSMFTSDKFLPVRVPGSTVDRLRARSSHLWTEALLDSLALSVVDIR